MNIPKGLIISEHDERDYIMGGARSIGGEEVMPGRNWVPFVPTYEAQRKRFFDDYGCVTHAKQNSLETQLIEKMRHDGGRIKRVLKSLGMLDKEGKPDFSDRFTVVMSGTIPWVGNSPRNVAECLRKDGVVGEKAYPFREDIRQREYYQPVPKNLQEQAKKFKDYFSVSWEWVGSSLSPRGSKPGELYKALGYAPITVCVDTRSPDRNGTLYNVRSGNYYNHEELLVAAVEGVSWTTYNTYRRKFKKYDWSYRFAYDMRLSIELKTSDKDVNKFLQKYQGECVKGSGPAIYLIKGRSKRAFTSWFDYVAFTGGNTAHKRVDDILLSLVEHRGDVSIEHASLWPVISPFYKELMTMKEEQKIEFLLNIIAKHEEKIGSEPPFSLLKTIIKFFTRN